MNNMENYFLIATISSIAFYAIYYFFLRKESCHHFNRFYLLAAMGISLLIPLVRFSIQQLGALFFTPHTTVNISEFIAYIQLPEFTVAAPAASWWSFSNIIWGIYFSGVLVFAILFIIKLIKISTLILQSKKHRTEKYVFVEYRENIAPFSFFNYIFINENAYSHEDRERIVLHEQIHVQKRHSWDLIFIELVGILLWFNPIILLYKRSLQIIHEYMADHCVLQQGIELGAYFNLLLRQLTLPNEWMLGHHFNYLLTKNRFKMLKNHHYSKWALGKALYVAPFIAFLLLLNCKHNLQEELISENQILCDGKIYTLLELSDDDNIIIVDEEGNERTDYTLVKVKTKQSEEEKNSETFLDNEGTIPANAVISWVTEEEDADGDILRKVEVIPEPIGDCEDMYKFLQNNLKYPQEARNKGITGTILVEFVVEKDGTISNVKALGRVNPDLGAEAVRVVKMLPKWKPGIQDGEPVRCFYNLPIRFSLN